MKRSLYLLLILLMAVVANPARGQNGDANRPQPVYELHEAPFVTQRAGSLAELDAGLLQLANSARAPQRATAELAEKTGLQLENGRVQVQLNYDDLRAAAAVVELAGGQTTGISRYGSTLQGWVFPSTLQRLAADPAITAVRRPHLAEPVETSIGRATSEALAAMSVNSWHDAGIRGRGVKVAVIDVGFSGAQAIFGSDLPSSVTGKNFVDNQTDSQVYSTSTHGTRVTEIIYDIAPEAQYYLIKISTNIDLEQAVQYAIDQGVDLISTSLIWYNVTPGDGTGMFADLVARARRSGILWITAAGNDRERHWGGRYNDSDGDGWMNFPGGVEVNYLIDDGSSPVLIPPGKILRARLRWNDWSIVNQNLNIYFVRTSQAGQVQYVAASSGLQNGSAGQVPAESVLAFTTGDSAYYGIAVHAHSLSRAVDIDLVVPGSYELDIQVTDRSLGNLADAPQALTVAAVDWQSPYAQHWYSAEGPTNGRGGSASADGAYNKPDISGFAGITTTLGSFYGTSAATPHVTGAAALILSANSGYTAGDLWAALVDNARDLGPLGYDTDYGHGRLYLKTMAQPPTPTPTTTPLPVATDTPQPTATNTPKPTATSTKAPTPTPSATTEPPPPPPSPPSYASYLVFIGGYPGPDYDAYPGPRE
jgi:subtilisin family serine protease